MVDTAAGQGVGCRGMGPPWGRCPVRSVYRRTAYIKEGSPRRCPVGQMFAGLAYETDTHSGFTNENGEFTYEEGESITFSIGGIRFPAVAGGSTVTPFDLFEDESEVINVARLLQSLDEDGDPENGITITDQAHVVAADIAELDFSDPDFASATQVVNLIANSGSSNTSIVDKKQASNHLDRYAGVVGIHTRRFTTEKLIGEEAERTWAWFRIDDSGDQEQGLVSFSETEFCINLRLHLQGRFRHRGCG